LTILCRFGALFPGAGKKCVFSTIKDFLQTRFRLVLLIWISLDGAGVLSAADMNVGLGLSGGRSFLPDRNVQDRAGASYLAHFTNKFQLGVLAVVDLHAPLALEVGFRNEWADFNLPNGVLLPNTGTIGFTVQQVFCNAVYYTPYSDGGLRLFATGGAGFRRINPASGVGSYVGWSLNFGGGLEARPSRRLSIRVEMRDFVGDMPRLVLSQSPGGLLHDIQVSLGFIVHIK
jgi:hypothetical protein